MRISDWGSDVCSSDLHCERSEAISSHRRCPTPMAGDCFVAPLLAMTMMSGLVRQQPVLPHRVDDAQFLAGVDVPEGRSEEHPSELQSLMRISYAAFCLKKKNNNITILSTPDIYHQKH